MRGSKTKRAGAVRVASGHDAYCIADLVRAEVNPVRRTNDVGLDAGDRRAGAGLEEEAGQRRDEGLVRPFDRSSRVDVGHLSGVFGGQRGEGEVQGVPLGIMGGPLGLGDRSANQKDVRPLAEEDVDRCRNGRAIERDGGRRSEDGSLSCTP